jgi:hypothetical protein
MFPMAKFLKHRGQLMEQVWKQIIQMKSHTQNK